MGQVQRRAGGRQSLLTTEVRTEMIGLLQTGMPVTKVGPALGISERAVMYWLQRGREEQDRIDAGRRPRPRESPYLQFLQDATCARAEFMARQLVNLGKSAQGGYVVKRRTRNSYDREGNITATEIDEEIAQPNPAASKFLLERSFRNDFGPGAAETNVHLFAGDDPAQAAQDAASADADAVSKLAARLRATMAALPAGDPGGGTEDTDIEEAELVDDD